MGQVVFGLHTGTMKKWVSEKEANSIKSFFGVKPTEPLTDEMSLYPTGITRLWIEEVRGKTKPRFYLHMKVNFARVLGISDYTVMPFTTANMRKVVTAVTAVLKRFLSNGNEQFSDWTVERLDTAFDVYEEHTALMMQLLNFSLDLSNSKKKCQLIPIPGKEPEDTIFESMRFGNDSYVWNVYVKLTQLLSEGKPLTDAELEEVRELLRAERQNHESALRKLLPHMIVADLATVKVREAILKIMIDDIRVFFGNGNFYSWKAIKERFADTDRAAEIAPIVTAMQRITANSLAKESAAYTKEVAEVFAKLGISPAGIQKQLAQQYGVDYLDGLYSRIVSQYQRPADKRAYGDFPTPHKGTDGRFRAVITLYDAMGKKRLSVAGQTLEDYEAKVSYKLRKVCLLNRISMRDNPEPYERSLDSLRRFQRVAKTKEVKQEISIFLKPFILKLEKDKNSLTK